MNSSATVPGLPCAAKHEGPPNGRAFVCLVARGGVEPPTFHFSGGRSYQLSYLAEAAQS